MDIKAFNNFDLAAKNQVPAKTQKSNESEKTVVQNKTASNRIKSAVPYVAGAVLLAGLGFYYVKNKGQGVKKLVDEVKDTALKITKKPKTVEKNIAKEAETVVETSAKEAEIATQNTAKEIEKVVDTAEKEATIIEKNVAKEVETVAENSAKEVKTEAPVVAENIENIEKTSEETVANIAQKVETVENPENTEVIETVAADVPKKVKPAERLHESVKSFISKLNLEDETILEKIKTNRTEQQNHIDRIINENYRDGHINLKMMGKIAKDYVADVANRGENRFHQAADLLEQSLIKETIQYERECQKAGLDEYLQAAKKTPLYKIYDQMPAEEAVTRVKHLKENDLYADWYTPGPSLDEWFDETVRIIMKNKARSAAEAEKIAK